VEAALPCGSTPARGSLTSLRTTRRRAARRARANLMLWSERDWSTACEKRLIRNIRRISPVASHTHLAPTRLCKPARIPFSQCARSPRPRGRRHRGLETESGTNLPSPPTSLTTNGITTERHLARSFRSRVMQAPCGGAPAVSASLSLAIERCQFCLLRGDLPGQRVSINAASLATASVAAPVSARPVHARLRSDAGLAKSRGTCRRGTRL